MSLSHSHIAQKCVSRILSRKVLSSSAKSLALGQRYFVTSLVRRSSTDEHSSTSFFGNVRSMWGSGAERKKKIEDRDIRENASNPYIRYPLITEEQMKTISNDKYKLDFSYASYAHHSLDTDPTINSLSDLTDPTLLNSLLPRRRPHQSPVDTLSIKAGDDAMLVCSTTMAIADGVSGWESKGEQSSSGIWARSMLETLSRLMTEYKISHVPHHLNNRDIEQILDDTYLHTSHLMDLQGLKGSSTLVLGMLSGDMLKMISIGDSKIYIIRDGEIVKTNEEQMVSDLCPKQIGTQTLNVLPSQMCWVDDMELQEGDLIVMCSDGISDNLYEWEILEMLNKNMKKDNMRKVANRILAKAKQVAFDDHAYTPYNEKVNKINPDGCSIGGKLDDMSLAIAKVVPNLEKRKIKQN